MATVELLTQIEQGNIHKRIPVDSYDVQVKPIYEEQLKSVSVAPSVEFDPEVHLVFKKEYVNETPKMTMEELGLTSPTQISEVGVTNPFPLFSKEAVEIMRSEVLREEVFKNCARVSMSSTSGLDAVIRGYAKDSCPFTYAAWKHPKTIEAVSLMAGVELELIMDYEIAQINVGMKSAEQAKNERADLARRNSLNDSYNDDIPAIVGWHNDSYPFVCVLMLSDTTYMIGGETLLKTGTGKIIPTPGPSMGKAVVLQGRKILHLAPVPLGSTERITAVSSYRAKNSLLPDTSVLKTVKPETNYGSIYNDFYPEWLNCRMKVIMDRAANIKEKFNTAAEKGEKFDKEEAFKLLKDLDAYVKHSWTEMEVSDKEYAAHFIKKN
ncbi:hypothetical protein BVG19_g1446 [[Candida] boidinii]|nr:hypothetical protein BVG19_g1446 [[Candida] boidinii]OWB53969.1 hypothetical protein B5S27_g5588 [[Candida] boidinii]